MSAAAMLEHVESIEDGLADQLAAVRPADWRFLLPDPTPRRVAYLAPADPATVAALQAIGSHVDVLDDLDVAEPPPGTAPYDVVIGGDRTLDAASLVASGGCICLRTRGTGAGRAKAALRRGGWAAVEAWWMWPDAAGCRELVPLRGPALRRALGRRDPGARLRLRVRAAQLLARTPLICLAIRDAIVIGRAP